MNKKIFCITVLLAQVIFIYLVVISNINTSVSGYFFTYKKPILALFPQGWGFFTKSCRDTLMDIYVMQPDKDFEKVTFSNHHWKNLLGVSRKSRRIAMDMAIIAQQITDIDTIRVQNWQNLYIAKSCLDCQWQLQVYYHTPWAYYAKLQQAYKGGRDYVFIPQNKF